LIFRAARDYKSRFTRVEHTMLASAFRAMVSASKYSPSAVFIRKRTAQHMRESEYIRVEAMAGRRSGRTSIRVAEVLETLKDTPDFCNMVLWEETQEK
jgi:hypothetical protein